MKINILGWFNRRNAGDESFKYAHQVMFKGHDVTYVTPPEPFTDPDIIVLGGGAVAAPFYLDVLPVGPKRYALGIDIAYESEIALLNKYNFEKILIRNKTDGFAYTPDLAFMMKPTNQDIIRKYKNTKKKTVGVLVTDYVNPAIDRPINDFANTSFDFKVKLAKELDILVEKDYEILLIPCATAGYGDDRRINMDIKAFMHHADMVVNIFDTLDPQSMIDLIAQLDLAICMRYHAHIFCLIANTPFVSIEYTRKVKLLLTENGLTEAIFCTYNKDSWFPQFNISVLKPIRNAEIAKNNYKQLQEVTKEVQGWLQ